jgi:hypothetical protein
VIQFILFYNLKHFVNSAEKISLAGAETGCCEVGKLCCELNTHQNRFPAETKLNANLCAKYLNSVNSLLKGEEKVKEDEGIAV